MLHQLRTATRLTILAALLTLGVLFSPPAQADQGSLCMPTTGTVSGLTFSQDVNAALQALVTANSGATEPVNPCSLAPEEGQFWLDTSSSPAVLKLYDGTAWETLGTVDVATGRWTPPIGGGADSIASATTVDLWSTPESYITVSGTTTVTAFATNGVGVTGSIKVVVFSGIAQITYNATSMILPGATDITTQAGDRMIVVNLGGGNAAVLAYTRADGTPIAPITNFSSQVAFSGTITPTSISGTTNNWNPTGLSGATTIRVTPSATVSLTGIVAQPAGTMLMLQNISASVTMTLVDESASSTAANRFALSADWPIGPEDAVYLRYDGTASRWVVVGAKGRMATQSEATTGTDNIALMTPLRVDQAIDGAISAGYVFVQRTAYTADTTWSPAATVTYIHVRMCGGGGGGGGADNSDDPAGAAGGGGGAGETVDFWVLVSALTTPVTIDIGTAGTGGTSSGTSGTAGADTTFGSYATANGGNGGTGITTGDFLAGNGGTGGTGGTGPAGAMVFSGDDGATGAMGDGGAGAALVNGTGGNGGSSTMGGGGRGRTENENSNVAGDAAGNYCSGGGGAVAFSTTGAAGGAGSAGFMFVEEYRSVK